MPYSLLFAVSAPTGEPVSDSWRPPKFGWKPSALRAKAERLFVSFTMTPSCREVVFDCLATLVVVVATLAGEAVGAVTVVSVDQLSLTS